MPVRMERSGGGVVNLSLQLQDDSLYHSFPLRLATDCTIRFVGGLTLLVDRILAVKSCLYTKGMVGDEPNNAMARVKVRNDVWFHQEDLLRWF